MRPIFIPPPIRRSQKCPRCGLLFSLKEEKCTHCSGLNSQELIQLLGKFEAQRQGNMKMIVLFGLGWLIVLAILVFFFI